MKIKVLLPIFALFALSLSAQKTITTEEQTWFAFLNQTRLSNKWGFWFDTHLRLKDDFVGELSQFIIRAGPTYHLSDDVRLTAAYAYVHHFPTLGHANIGKPEHRPWQQVQWFVRWPKARLMQWVRLEERFQRKILNDDTLDEGYNFNWRIRYNFALFLPITKKRFEPGGLQFLLNDELMINFGKNITYNHFDQNRIFAGLVFQVNKHAQLHAGYMNLYLQRASGNSFNNQHTIRVFYFHNFDLRK
jgi:Protein of unknown function (DUF2490)